MENTGIFGNLFGSGKTAKAETYTAESVATAFNALPAEQQALVAEVTKTYKSTTAPAAPAETQAAAPVDEKKTDTGNVAQATATPATPAQPTDDGKGKTAEKILAAHAERKATATAPASTAQADTTAAPAQPTAPATPAEPTPEKPKEEYLSKTEHTAYTAKLEQLLEQQAKQHAEQMAAMQAQVKAQEERFAKFVNPEKEYNSTFAGATAPKRTTHAEVVAKYIGK